MLRWLFGAGRRTNRTITDALYDEIVAAARQPVLYSGFLVPDTPLGRFEMVSLHMFLALHRLRDGPAAAREIAQDITDEFFKDVDHSLRELGIGDQGVPRRMKKLGRMFYGRAVAYGRAIDEGDGESLAAALRRNVRPDAEAWPEAEALAAYAMAAWADLKEQPTEALVAGRLCFRRAGAAGEGVA